MMKFWLSIATIALLLSGCASTYPLGMNETQWKALSVQEREKLLLQQQKIQAEQHRQQMQAKAAERERQHQKELAEKARLQALYESPNKGDVIMLNILGGNFMQGKRSKRILEETYQIARGETQQISLLLIDNKNNTTSTETAYLKYALNGNGVYLFLDNPNYHNNRHSRIALLRDGHWTCGSQYNKNLNTRYTKLKKMKFFIKEIGQHCTGNRKNHPRMPRKVMH